MMLSKIDSGSDSRERWKVREMPALIDRSRRGIRDVGAVEGDAPRVGAIDAGDDVEERGLAGAVRADQAEDLVRRDGEIEPVERHHAAEVLGQAAGFEQHAHGRHPGK